MNPAILCIDDQREVLAALLKDLSGYADLYDLVDCESAGEASALVDELTREGQPIAMILSDHVMPDRNGLDLLRELVNRRDLAHTKFVLLTGYAAHEDLVQAEADVVDASLTKPWHRQQLTAVVNHLLASPSAVHAAN